MSEPGGVEAHGVGNIEGFPREPDCLLFAHVPNFGKTGVDTEVARATERITLPGFAGVGWPEGAHSSGGGAPVSRSR